MAWTFENDVMSCVTISYVNLGDGDMDIWSNIIWLFLGHVRPSYACSIIVFWKHITSLVSQVHSGRGILPQDESYFESHPYLI